MASDRNESLRTDSIRPTFRGGFLERFLHLVEDIDQLSAIRQRDAVLRELCWADTQASGGIDRLKYTATLAVLRDLLGQGWRVQFRQRSIFLSRPEYTHGHHEQLDPHIVKSLIRDAFSDERLAQIRLAPTVKFIHMMEQPKGLRRSVLDLVADGESLATSLATISSEPTPADLRRVVNPYLQLVETDERDQHTGLRLIDIWRYFRYSWVIPLQPTPGRNLFYLVRDAARPFHPVMGIAALGNSIVQLSGRDRAIGWSLESIEKELVRRQRSVTRQLPKSSPAATCVDVEYLETEEEHRHRISVYASRLVRSMLEAIEADLHIVNHRGLVTKREISNPTPEVIARLFDAAKVSERERQDDLRTAHQNGESIKRMEGKGTWREDTDSPLFRRKRAIAIAECLPARLQFQAEGVKDAPVLALQRLLATDEGKRAIRTALHANKKAKIGCSLMDLIVCGAIPPYNELLGGKLVAMLLASPQVIHDYQNRYGDQPSEIASRLAGRKVVRPADLVFLGTTSLYHVGSSQYERIHIPAPRGERMSYECLGHTEGYGSTVLSTETVERLREVTVLSKGMRRVNNVFGEGVSPRLRQTREGLSLLGIPQTHVLKHSCPRLIYGVQLASNAYSYLRGEEATPKYFFPPKHYLTGTRSIADAWLLRWFLPRCKAA